ncbi:MAG: CsgG/HfaB family protein [Candidatus Aegiribacteria sp.]
MKPVLTVTAALLSAALFISGCNTASQMASMGVPSDFARSPVLDSKPHWRTVVLPPSSPTESSEVNNENLMDYAGLALLRTGKFTLVDRSVVDQLLDEQEFSYSGVVDQSTAVELGRLLGAEAVMTIRVSSISHDGFWDDEPDQRDAGILVKIVSVETSEVLYTSTGEGSSFNGAEDALRMAMEVALIGLFK